MESLKQIFVSHSSKDTRLINLITLSFKGRRIVPFFARREMAGENPVEKIIKAIDSSMALFLLMTENVVNDTHTRDWVVFEIGVAKAKNVPIFCWMHNKVGENESFPKLLENITDYDTFDYYQDEECYRVVTSMLDKALKLEGTGRKVEKPTRKEIAEGLIQMQEARIIATNFVQNDKKPDNIRISSIEPVEDRWIVKGTIFIRGEHASGTEKWAVEIKGREVLSFKYEPGLAWAIL